MKSMAWITAIVVAGLLLGYALHLTATRSAANTAAPSSVSGVAASAPPYQVGQHLPTTPDLSTTPYRPAPHNSGAFKEIAWEALIPKNWDAMAPFKGVALDKMEDGDPRAMEALWKARKYWKNAPIDPSMDGASIRIPGFVVSLEREGDALTEFLLVPYFGACIHVPPPPANQIIHVHSTKAIPGIRSMDAVWISGILKVQRSDTMMGSAGYSMQAIKVEAYTDPAS